MEPEDSQVALTVAIGPSRGRSITTNGAGQLLVGRAPDCHLQVVDRRMSREHFVAEWSAGSWKIRDLTSRNGTFLNDQRVDGIVDVRDGDLLRAGDTEFKVKLSESSQRRIDSTHLPAAQETSPIATERTSQV